MRARTDEQRNLFISYINQGRIDSLEELKRTYRQIVMKTHPDAVGSDRLVEEYIECRRCYEEAKAIFNKEEQYHDLGADEGVRDYRLLFYQEFYRLERIDKPYAFNKYYFSKEQIERCKQQAFDHFRKWQQGRIDLYQEAIRIYDQIKLKKPRGPFRKHALLFNLSPVNFAAVLFQLEQRNFHRLVEFEAWTGDPRINLKRRPCRCLPLSSLSLAAPTRRP